MSNRQITPISPDTEEAILRKSAHGLPIRPSEAGMKPDDIKKAFFEFVTGASNSLISELKRVVAEGNIILDAIQQIESEHESATNNPHSVTKAQVGLGNVDNTSDTNKPISQAQQAAFNERVKYSDIQDNYTSIATNKPLSANRGRLLDGRVTENKNAVDLAIKNITLNSENGILTITRTNGTTFSIDLPTEYLVKSGTYNATTKEIWLELDNDTLIKIPVAALVNEYYADGTTLTMYIDANDGNKVKFKISDDYKSKIDSNTSKRHEHSNKSLLDTYTQTNANLSDAVDKKHSHSNKAVLDATTASFTTAKQTQLDNATSDIEELRDQIAVSGTVIYDAGTPLTSFSLEDIVFAALGYLAENAVTANRCSKGGEIDRRLKALENK